MFNQRCLSRPGRLLVPLFAVTSVFAADAGEAGAAKEAAFADPPYQPGDRIVDMGYTIEREGNPIRINFRIVENRIRIYWLDADGRVVAPEAAVATVRFTGSVRGRSYHRATLLPEGGGLGAPGIVPPPHLRTVVLVIDATAGSSGDASPNSYRFRYTPAMSRPKAPGGSREARSGGAAPAAITQA